MMNFDKASFLQAQKNAPINNAIDIFIYLKILIWDFRKNMFQADLKTSIFFIDEPLLN